MRYRCLQPWLANATAYALALSFVFSLGLSFSASAFAQANPLTELKDSGSLYVKTYIQPDSGLVPAQKIRLTIEIGTDNWFTGGTRIGIPEVPGLIILQNEQFASNATESIDGKTWVVQRWSLDVFAQRAGDFTVPPMRLTLQVNAGSAGDVRGELLTPVTQFTVNLPQPLQELQAQERQWLASEDFTVSQQFDRDINNLSIGDAIEWQITFAASDVMAMMLPSAEMAEQEGMASYAEPPSLENRNNRGTMRASRTQRFSLVAEAPGEYQLPEQTFSWWDTNNAELKTVALPAQKITVFGELPAQDATSKPILTLQMVLYAGAGLVLVLALLALLHLARKLPWDQMVASCTKGYQRLQQLRLPALPQTLNPRNDQPR